jgi:hypothetical protein
MSFTDSRLSMLMLKTLVEQQHGRVLLFLMILRASRVVPVRPVRPVRRPTYLAPDRVTTGIGYRFTTGIGQGMTESQRESVKGPTDSRRESHQITTSDHYLSDVLQTRQQVYE